MLVGFVFGVLFCAQSRDEPIIGVGEDPGEEECFGMLFPEPGDLDFGQVDVGETVEAQLLLMNEGGCLTQIVELDWIDGTGFFDVEPPESLLLASGEVLPLTVTFTPQDLETYENFLWVETSRGEAWEIPVFGEGVAGQAEVTPGSLSFDTVAAGCEVAETVTVTNTGNAPLVLEELAWSDEGPFLAEAETPMSIDPGESASFEVIFAPEEAAVSSGSLTLRFDSGLTPEVDLSIDGEAVDDLTVELSRTWRTGVPADLLLAVSTTESMTPHLEDLDDGFDAMLDALDETGVDWQVSVVTQDSGCALGTTAVVHPGLSRGLQEAALRTMLWSPSESGSEDARRPLALAKAALSAENIGAAGCNEGFRRSGATLGIIGVINGPDQSPDPVSDYLARFEYLVEAPELLTVHGVGGPDGGCNGVPYSALLGEAIAETGGTLYPICAADLGLGLDWIVRRAVADPTRLYLPEVPDVGTLEVWQNDVLLTEGWSWSEALNAVVFETPPQNGDEVVARYIPAEACEG
ncbi:MAG: choice-of-anchor D domain-containing protein [Alphaproteobacteria bacterium]|nr:choice-of-anchor D domain-containing protein [Alphaproteobacteria bacterium]